MPQIKQETRMGTTLSARKLILYGLSFAGGLLIGRVCIGDAIWPFGPGYVLAAFLNEKTINPYLALAGVMTALATYISQMEYIAFHFAVVGLIGAAMILCTHLMRKVKKGVGVLVAFGAYAVATILFKLIYLYAALTSIVEFSICILMMVIFCTAIQLFFHAKHRVILTDLEIISLSILAILCVLGLGDISAWGISLRNIAAIYISMIAAYLGGASVGAGVGLMMGFAAVIGGSDPMLMAILGIGALGAGAVKRLKKTGVILSFVLINAVMTFYLNGSSWVIIPLVDSGIAAAGFALTPKKTIEFLGRFVDANLRMNYEQKMHVQQFRDLTVGRLKEISRVFSNAGKVFGEARKKEENGISYMMADIPERACGQCVFYDVCWDKEFSGTYQSIQKLYKKYETGGHIQEKDLGKEFLNRCVRPRMVVETAKKTFYKYNTNYKWQNKVLESRAVVGDQLRGVSRVIDSLSREVDVALEFRRDLEESITERLDQYGITAREVCVEEVGDNIHVALQVKGCGGAGQCTGTIRKAISGCCGIPMCKTADVSFCTGKKVCTLKYEPIRKFEVITGIAGTCKQGNKVSGDAHSFEGFKDGRYMLLLCDGMGSGERAAKESNAAVSLMEDFYRAGFDDTTILDAINKLLLLSSTDEMFSTMDLCMLDLITGQARFTKIGAPHSYLFRRGKFKKIQAGSLPLGILDEFEPEVYEAELTDGDMIVMFTDGIADLEMRNGHMFEALKESLRTRNPQEAADNILRAALELYDEKATDDMTVMVSRVRKNR